jgi:flagellar basal body-associated protein FliL
LYSLQKGDTGLTSSYDWCDCGLGALAIIGIILFIMVIIGAIVAGIYFFNKKKQQNQQEGYGAVA